MAVKVRVERTIGDCVLSMETGLLAKQAAGSVLVQYGETVVLVRCGPEGGVVASKATGSDTKIRLPAFPDTRVVDVTGCGNSFMGGFLAGLDVEGYTAEPEHATVEQLARACAWGHTSASFMAEVVGVPPVGFMGGLDRSEVQRRFDTIWAGKTVLDDDGDI